MNMLIVVILGLVLVGLLLTRSGLLDRMKTNQSDIEAWFQQSRLRVFGIPFLAANALCVLFYLFGGIESIAQFFATAFVGFILFNLVYRVSGRHTYRLGISIAFMFVFFGAITSLILFNLG